VRSRFGSVLRSLNRLSMLMMYITMAPNTAMVIIAAVRVMPPG
jgi:hypothetical protein